MVLVALMSQPRNPLIRAEPPGVFPRSTYQRVFAGGKFRVIVLKAREQMPVHVEGHLDRAMSE